MNKPPFIGLAVRALHVQPGQRATFQELKDWIEAGGDRISRERVRQIYERGMRKVRAHLYRDVMTNDELREAFLRR